MKSYIYLGEIHIKKTQYIFYAFLIWLVTFVIISVLVVNAPLKRTVVPVYINAVDNWINQKDLYNQENYLFHYLPNFVFIYYPFYLLGTPLGDILWRLVSLAILITGIWLFANHLFHDQRDYKFFLITLLVIASTIGALRNGQANLIFAGVLLLIAYFTLVKKWWVVSLLLVFLITIKQIGIIVAGLIIFAYPQVAIKTVFFSLIFIVVPFVSSNYDYVMSQYTSAFAEMTKSINPTRGFADINGFLSVFGVRLDGLGSILMRALAGIITLLIWLYVKNRFNSRYIIVYFLVLSSGYLMLFHPMTEQNSYVIVAPPIAIFALMLYTEFKVKYIPYVLMFVCVSLGLLPELVRPLFPNLGMWYKPFSIIVVMGILLSTMKIPELKIKNEENL